MGHETFQQNENNIWIAHVGAQPKMKSELHLSLLVFSKKWQGRHGQE